MRTILVSGYFGGEGHTAKLRYFERMDTALRAHGFRVSIFDLSPVDAETALNYVRVPWFIMAGHKVNGARYFGEDDVAEPVKAAASIEAANRNGALLDSCVKMLFFRAFFREQLRRQRPALCVLWHQLNAMHRAAQDVCDALHLPCALTEYGVLPGTIGFETGGQMGESRVAREPEWFLHLPVDDADLERADRYLEYVHREKKTRKDQASEFDLDTCVKEARALGRKLVFYAGQQDYASGLVPRALPESHIHSPYFADTVDALRHLAELAERNNWHIVFKPHPILANRSKNFKTAHPGRVDVALGANLFDCMEQCDVTTTIVSQVSYMALIHHRPCVLLGRTQLTGKGCVYEPRDFADIETVFQRALAEGFTAEQRTAWRRHVAQVMRHYAFGFEDDAAELLGRGVDDAARYLAELANDGAPQQPASLWNGDLRPATRGFKLRATYRALRTAEPILRALSAILPGDLKAALKKRYR